MTSELKCPVCPYCCKPLHCGAELNVDGHNVEMWYCTNYACEQSEDLIGTREMWELVANRIQAKQDLEIARKALKDIASGQIIEHSVCGHEDDNKIFIARKALTQIKQRNRDDVCKSRQRNNQ